MFWLLLLALMILIPVLAALYTWRELRREAGMEAGPLAYSVDLPPDGGVAHGSNKA